MTNKEIIKMAVQKAIDRGFDKAKLPAFYLDQPQMMIFNHDFAQALWGEEEYPTIAGISIGDYSKLPNWKYHLAHAVLADDPIKYLGENI